MIETILGVVFFLSGFVLGGLLLWFIKRNEIKSINKNSEDMKATFAELSGNALDKNMDTFFKLAENQFSKLLKSSDAQLSEKKKLIDSSLNDMKRYMENLGKSTTELKGQMENSQEGVNRLRETTSQLRRILSSSQARGQWGERMVEDILNFIGLEKGINYEKQKQEGTDRPDYTFILPKNMRINMDVKFPLEHYENYLSTEDESEKEKFLKDVRNHVKAIAGRGYIDPAGGTVDYVLMFIPNESIYTFLNKEDKNLIDLSLSRKIILCSPITLYAVLSLIRQSVENFSMETKAGEMQKMMGEFASQWEKFVDKMERLGNSIETVQNHYRELSVTRTNRLEKPVKKILDLKLNKPGDEERIGN